MTQNAPEPDDRSAIVAKNGGQPRADVNDADDDEGSDPLALSLGLLAVLILLLASWLLIHQMHCNPLFSDAGLARSQACR